MKKLRETKDKNRLDKTLKILDYIQTFYICEIILKLLEYFK